MWNCAKNRIFLAVIILGTQSQLAAQAINPNRPAGAATAAASASTADNGLKAAYALYQQQRYAESAQSFEVVLRSAPPSAKVYYYAILANRACNRTMRAKQLSDFVVKNFATSQEASYCKQMYPADAAPQDIQLPESVKATLSPEMQVMLQTAEGKAAIREAYLKDPSAFATVKTAEKQGLISQKTVAGAKVAMATPGVTPFASRNGKERPFTAADIARDGSGGIDQSRFPNCWFECSMSALAELPRGQQLMASMIRYGEPGSYVVRFPGDGKEYIVTENTLKRTGIHDKALWASIIECAQVQKFPNNSGANGADNDQNRLEVGLGCITGCKAETIMPSTVSPQEVSTFIGGAISSKNPIICGTFSSFAGLPPLAVPLHAYTVIGFDASKNMITIRNPHGKNSQEFDLDSDPQHRDFEWMQDGVFKMSIPLFQKYFHSVARSFI
ncbi:MAG TPA: hypothetical protein V6C76_05830 [Drouetiella sp.]